MKMVLMHNGNPVPKLPYTIPNSGLRVLRWVAPNTRWPSGKLVVNNPAAMENYDAAPPALGMNLVPAR